MQRLHRPTRSELSRIEDYYQAAGEKRARLRYVEGMLVLGALWVVLAAVLSAVVIWLFGLLDFPRFGAGVVGGHDDARYGENPGGKPRQKLALSASHG